MHVTHAASGHTMPTPPVGFGMKIMAVMMGLCLGGTVLAVTAPTWGLAVALVPASLAAAAFVAISWLYHRWMAPLMGLCCGAGALVIALPTNSWPVSWAIALAFGLVVGVGSHFLMRRHH